LKQINSDKSDYAGNIGCPVSTADVDNNDANLAVADSPGGNL